MLNYKKYKRFQTINFKERTWPNKEITKAPIWCSVDLRDGNQALVNPMTVEEKKEMFQLLVELGFKEIEIGFPSASQIEFDFLRTLVDENLISKELYEVFLLVFSELESVEGVVVHVEDEVVGVNGILNEEDIKVSSLVFNYYD